VSLPPADLRFERRGANVYAHVRGDIDMSNARDLRDELSTRTPNDALGLILDLTEVEYLDSAGIHFVHHLRENLRAGGQQLVLVIPADSPIKATLRLAGLDWSGHTVDTPELAADALRPPGQRPVEAGGGTG
jgi:anti-anti-sigma factor